MTIPGPLLEKMAEEGRRYPYFLQVWGAALWGAIQGERRPLEVTQAHVDAARPAFEKTRRGFYGKRWSILHKNIPLRSAANAVAEEFLRC